MHVAIIINPGLSVAAAGNSEEKIIIYKVPLAPVFSVYLIARVCVFCILIMMTLAAIACVAGPEF